MAQLDLNFLGPFRANLDGQAITSFRSRKVQALLIYLAAEASGNVGNRVSRESLMTLLWPDIQLQSARTNLRQALSQLRKTIPSIQVREGTAEVPFLLADRQTVGINPDA